MFLILFVNLFKSFFTRSRLKLQVDLIETEYHDREVRELWPQLERKIAGLFEGIEIQPALLHGDLWSGNVAQTSTEPGIGWCSLLCSGIVI